MYRASMIIGGLLIGGVICLAMFPSLRSGMAIDTDGWLPLFVTMVRFLPYCLIALIIIWLLALSRGSGSR
jgi:hypothetical protein